MEHSQDNKQQKDLFSIFDLIEGSTEQNKPYPSETLHKILNSSNIAIYGFGSGYHSIKSFILDKFGKSVFAVIDQSFKSVEFKDDLLYLPPNEVGLFSEGKNRPYSNLVIPTKSKKHSSFLNERIDLIIVSLGSRVEFEKVKVQLTSLGSFPVIWALSIPEYHLTHTSIPDIFASRNLILNSKLEILKAFQLLYDDTSRDIFLTLLQSYAFGESLEITSLPLQYQYQMEKSLIPVLRKYHVFVDCGANKGETSLIISKIEPQLRKIYALEPDSKNFLELMRNLQLPESEVDLVILEVACLDFNGSVEFCSYGVNSKVAGRSPNFRANSYSEVRAIKLDSLIEKVDLILIKMDIEGSEMKALLGSRKLIQEAKPDLLISVYHQMSDLWSIPVLLNTFSSNYRYYLRNYTSFPSETILVALQEAN